MKKSETETNKELLEYLLKAGFAVWRNNSGVMRSGKRFIRFGKIGSGDIIGMTPSGRFISIENKSNGEPVSKDQEEFAEMVKAKNGIALFVVSLDDLINQLDKNYDDLPF